MELAGTGYGKSLTDGESIRAGTSGAMLVDAESSHRTAIDVRRNGTKGQVPGPDSPVPVPRPYNADSERLWLLLWAIRL